MRLRRLAVIAILVLIAARIWARHGSGSVEYGRHVGNALTLTRGVTTGHSPSKLLATPQVATAKQLTAFGNLPMRFEENVGQTDGQVRFLAHGPGYVLFLTPGESIFKFSGQMAKPHTRANHVSLTRNPPKNQGAKTPAVLRMKMEGARGTPTIAGLEKQSGVSNYFIGTDPRKWQKGVPVYGKVQYTEVYSGIDLIYYGNQHQLEYDFVVKPGADPSQVSWSFEGTQKVSLDSASGNVNLDTPAGAMALRKPVIYQVENGQQKLIQGNYKIQANGHLAFDVKNYNRSEPLVIDPVLVYSTYLGGSGDDGGYSLALDSQGHAFITGYTDSTDFPIVGTSQSPAPTGNFKAFVAELAADGNSLLYSTYLGGSNGDFSINMALDSANYAYIVGLTTSTDFPVTANAFQTSLATGAASNAFLSKLSPDGQSLLYSTYLGGGGTDYGFGIAVDGNENAYLTGETTSGSPTPFPTTSTAFQSTLNSPYGNGFVSRIDTRASGASSLVYSTFLGGTTPGAYYWDQGSAIAVDADQNVYVVGMASSLDFPITSATAYQTRGKLNGNAYLTRIDTTKSGSAGLIYSTYLGGTGSTDQAASVALDSTGKVYLTGGTGSSDFPVTTNVTNSGEGKAFIAKFDTTQSQSASLVYSTLVGGSSGEFSGAIAVDPLGNAYISGWTFSSDFPVTADAIQSTKGSGVNNSFLAVLSTDASKILYGTYLGGSGSSNLSEFAYGLALDSNNNIYMTGGTGSPNFQTTSGTIQTSLNGSSDAFVMKLSALPLPIISSLSQLSGPTGAQVTVNGLGFGSSQGSSIVTFGSDTAPIVSWADTAIVVQVPSSAPLGLIQVVVTTSLEPSNAEPFIVTTSSPYIDRLSPSSGAPGTLLTITGSQFGATQGQGVTFNGIATLVSSWSDTSIAVRVPAGASTGGVTVTNGSNVTSNAVNFTVPLIVTGLSTNSGPVGASVSISGTGFGATQGSSAVTFNGAVATVSSWGASGIVATVPSGATTGNLVVTVSGANSNGLNFTVLPTPVITSLSATAGPVTTPITITGTGFGTTQGTSTVTFNGVAATISSWSATSVSTAVPVGAATGNVTVVLDGVASNGLNFTVTAPPLVSIAVTPASPVLFVTGTQQFAATGAYLDGTTQDLTATATWSSSNMSAATINATGLASAVALGQTTIQAAVGSVTGSANLTVGIFAVGGTTNSAHSGHTATLLTDGRVLIADGPVEIYTPPTRTFIDTGVFKTPRTSASATLLDDGTVLVAGGYDVDGNTLSSAEVYDPVSGTFTPAQNMITARASHAATLLSDGTVLITGGFDGNYNVLASAELYHPATQTFTQAGVMNNARAYQTGTLLNDGTVFVAGGSDNTGTALASAEIYNSASQIFTPTPTMTTARLYQTATLLNNGTVLLAGGLDNNFNPLSSAEIYDPVATTFTATQDMSDTRLKHAATLLNNGTVLVTGGTNNFGSVYSSVDLYDPATSTFTSPGPLNVGRFGHTSTLLADGTVLVAGGTDNDFSAVSSTELYHPSSFAPPNLVSITLSPSSPTISAGTSQAFTAIGTFSDNSTQILSSVTWTSSDNTMATVTSDSTNHGHAYALATGSATVSACVGSVCGSAPVTLSASQLLITSLSPAAGSVGTAVIVAGTGFGATQGTSTVTFNGVAATASSWSSTGIVVTVPIGASTGNVVVTVGSATSNGGAFTVISGPVITGLSPAIGAPGTSVTLTGSNFGSMQGSSTVTFNGAAATVSTWSDTSIVASVPALASTGNVVVSVSGVASSGALFTVTGIANVTPQNGPISTLVDIAGSGFGTTQGSGVASINGTPMNVVSWSDSQIFAAVASGTTTGTLTVQQGAVSLSGPTFTITASFPYKASPASLSMLVGETRTVTVTDSSGTPATGLRWITSDATIVSLSTDDPPVLTGVAAGSATVYAGELPISVTVYAGTSLPNGTPIWSLALGGTSELNIVPAVPSSSGVDVFTLDGTQTLSAISSDGKVVWKAPVISPFTTLLPDFSGGVELKSAYIFRDGNGYAHYTHVVQKVDPNSGALTTLYTFADRQEPSSNIFDDDNSTESVIPDTTGALFIQDNDNVKVFNLATGAQVGTTITLDSNTLGGVAIGPAAASTMIVAGDGNAYLPYNYSDETESADSTHFFLQTITHVMVLRVSPDGSFAKTLLQNWTSTQNCVPYTSPGGTDEQHCQVAGYFPTVSNESAITNADKGVAVFSTTVNTLCADYYTIGIAPFSETSCPDFEAHTELSYVSQDALAGQRQDAAVFPNDSGRVEAFFPVLQREDGSYIGTDSTIGFGYTNVIAMGASGGVLWEQPSNSNTVYLSPWYATSDGGEIITSSGPVPCPGGDVFIDPFDQSKKCQSPFGPYPYFAQGPLGTLYTLDQHGNNARDQDGNTIPPTPDTGARLSWNGTYVLQGSSSINGIAADIPALALTYAAVKGFNLTATPSGDGASVIHHSVGLFWCGGQFSGTCQGILDPFNIQEADLGFTYTPANSPNAVNDFTSNGAWTSLIMGKAVDALGAAFKGIPVLTPRHASPLPYFYDGQPDHIVNVANLVGNQTPPPDPSGNIPAGATYPICKSLGFVCQWNSVAYYRVTMKSAQGARNSLFSPVYPPVTNAQRIAFQNLLTAIGIGLGNVAAHEIGHQFKLPDMDCTGEGGCSPAPADLYYESAEGASPTFLDIGAPLSWTKEDQKILDQQLHMK